jgi:hypothetical protein
MMWVSNVLLNTKTAFSNIRSPYNDVKCLTMLRGEFVVKVLLIDIDSVNVEDPGSVLIPKIRQCSKWILYERRTSFGGSASPEEAL